MLGLAAVGADEFVPRATCNNMFFAQRRGRDLAQIDTAAGARAQKVGDISSYGGLVATVSGDMANCVVERWLVRAGGGREESTEEAYCDETDDWCIVTSWEYAQHRVHDAKTFSALKRLKATSLATN
jgi:hypothetical protein